MSPFEPFSVILHRCPEMRFVIVGDGTEALLLLRLSRTLGVSSQVSFAGWQSGLALLKFYHAAEVVVVPSLYEPFGMVALEAMACARPVIASSTGGLTEIITHGVNGLLTTPGDHLELAQRIADLLLNPNRAAQIGTAARQQASNFGWERVAKATERVYQPLVGDELAPPLVDPRCLIDKFIDSVDPMSRSLARRLTPDLERAADSDRRQAEC